MVDFSNLFGVDCVGFFRFRIYGYYVIHIDIEEVIKKLIPAEVVL